MRAYVGLTDGDWYRSLAARPELEEINFWTPSAQQGFKALDGGELFLFKLHARDGGAVVGGGTFEWYSPFPALMAWEVFGEGNGAASFEEMRRRIERYRRTMVAVDDQVGCIVLREPFFLPREVWIHGPRDWAPSIQKGKGYDLTVGAGRELWDQVSEGWRATNAAAGSAAVEFGESLARHRLGQHGFRLRITDAYRRRCAVTGERALPVLQAAHIRPVARQGEHRVDNGLLLRSDIHTLFDRGYVTITPELEFRASRRLRTEFDNGEEYFALQGHDLWLPDRPEDRPSKEFLEWHADEVFQA